MTLGLGALVAWRLYARIRRMVGRQRLSRWRPWFTVVLFPLLGVFLLLGALVHPLNAAALLGGAAIGVALGRYGLRLTRFEVTPAGLFYTPNAHLGIALSLLFIGRVVYRFVQLYFFAGATLSGAPPTEFLRSPLTLVIFGTLAAYYVTYALGLLAWRRQVAAG